MGQGRVGWRRSATSLWHEARRGARRGEPWVVGAVKIIRHAGLSAEVPGRF